MASYREIIRDSIRANAQWQSAFPNPQPDNRPNVFLVDDFGNNYLTKSSFEYERVGYIRLTAVIKFMASNTAEIRATSEKHFFQVFYYADAKNGWSEVDRASLLVKSIIDRKPLPTDSRGTVICRFVSGGPQFFEPNLQNVAAQYDEYEMKLRRR